MFIMQYFVVNKTDYTSGSVLSPHICFKQTNKGGHLYARNVFARLRNLYVKSLYKSTQHLGLRVPRVFLVSS